MTLTVAVTRPQPQADGTAALLRAAGYRVTLAPLLVLERLGDGGSATGFAALAFTSRTAPMLLASRGDLHRLPVFAVGDATAEEARRAGFADVTSAGGTADDLLALVRRAATGRVLHLAGEEQRGDLVERLGTAGIAAERRAIYRMVEAAALPGAVADAVLLYSPRSARIFASLAAGTAWEGVPCVAISAAAAEAVRLRHPVRVAREPTEPAMLAALGKVAAAQPARGR